MAASRPGYVLSLACEFCASPRRTPHRYFRSTGENSSSTVIFTLERNQQLS